MGQSLSEDGPWANRLWLRCSMRASLSLQMPDAGPWTKTRGYDSALRYTCPPLVYPSIPSKQSEWPEANNYEI